MISYTELRPSRVCSGVGVFAIQNILKGQDCFPYSRKDLPMKWSAIEDSVTEKLIKRLCHYEEDYFYISDSPVNLGMSYYVNHSDEPNIMYCKVKDVYLAIRDIAAGEELLCTYEPGEKDWLI